MTRISDLTAVATKSALSGLHPLLDSWVDSVKSFCKSREHLDNPWWYNERASLSVLAGAAWRLNYRGWTALEEFSTTKRGAVPKGSVDGGSLVRGRCDLHVAHKSAGFAIEAKQAWQAIGNKAQVDNVRRGMQLAWNDAGKLTCEEGDHRLALTFVSPYLAVSEVGKKRLKGDAVINETLVQERVASWLSTIALNSLDAHAYIFPRRTRGFVNARQTRIFPGALICIKRRRRGINQQA